MNNVVCVNWGTKYSEDYTHRLYNMVKRNTDRVFNFYVLTDQVDRYNKYSHYITIELNTDEVGWWNKLQMYNKGVLPDGEFLYFDLDVVIVDNIDWLLEYDGMFMGIEDLGAVNEHQPELKGRLQSGVMAWDYRLNSHLWNRFTSSGESQRYRGDGEYLNHIVPKYQRDFIQKRYKGKLKSYKYQVYSEGITDDLSIICFHGRPSIPQAMTETVTTGWKNSGKTYEPQDWIKDYWR